MSLGVLVSSTGLSEVNGQSPSSGLDRTAGSTPSGTPIPSSGSGSRSSAGNVADGVTNPSSSANGIITSGSSSQSIGAGSGNSGAGNSGTGNTGPGNTAVGDGNGNGNGNSGGSSPQPSSTVAPVFTAGGSTYTGNAATGFVIGSSTLTPGGTVIVPGSGTASPVTYVLPPSATAVIINGQTEALSNKTVAAASTTPFLVLGSSTYTANSASEFVIGSQTIAAGGVITAGGETLSLAPGGSVLVIISGTSTMTESLGGIIAFVGGFASSTSTPSNVSASAAGLPRFVDIWVLGAALSSGLLTVWVL